MPKLMPEFMPDLWPWEIIWVVACAGATASLLALVLARRRARPLLRPAAALAFCGLLLLAPFLLFPDWPARLLRRENFAETSADATDPGLRTRVFAQPRQVVFTAAVGVVERLPFWRLVLQDPQAGLIKAEVSVLLGLFTNDVLIRIDPAKGGTQVNLSASARRIGGDLGAAPRHILHFYRRLEWALDEG